MLSFRRPSLCFAWILTYESLCKGRLNDSTASGYHKGCWLKADPAPTKYPQNPTDTSGVVIAPTIITGPDVDTDYVCCEFNATALVPDFDKRFPGGVTSHGQVCNLDAPHYISL